ncbi:MAG: anti-sigma-factor antagonist [Cyanobacteria bacterium RYN_339]|nr:anti-sigma-factor antagonist [Cyanobacteria bacterium RYN_339]
MQELVTLMKANEPAILADWRVRLETKGGRVSKALAAGEQDRITKNLLTEAMVSLAAGKVDDIEAEEFAGVRRVLDVLSANFAERGFTPSETATFVYSLKEAFFAVLKQNYQGDALVTWSWQVGLMVDQMGLYTFESYVTTRERLIKGQAQAIMELSTPVIKVWDGIIALPLVGAVDSVRAKDIMERLLDAVLALNAEIVIIDITGVPVVDTQVANRLMRTVEAVRLLGTKSIITGINPVIAQTLVQLGVDLGQLTTKASLQAGLQLAFRELRISVGKREA